MQLIESLLSAVVSDRMSGDRHDPNVDLSTLLPALQGMKDEIASLPTMEERRKAAARVALGLVWALEGDV